MGLFHIIAMIIVGFIVGSLVGGVIGGLVFRSPDGKFHPAGWFLSIIGALLVLWVYLNYLQ